jgi:hypothetical protein
LSRAATGRRAPLLRTPHAELRTGPFAVARRFPAAYNRGMAQTRETGPPVTWQREILLRGILALLTAGLMLGVNIAVNRFGSPTDLPYILPPAAGFLAGLPEGLIRRSWRMGLLSSILGCAACALGYWLTWHLEGSSLLCPPAVQVAIASLGAAWGVAAGIGVRSLAAVLAAFVLGQAGGWFAGYVCNYAAWNLSALPELLGMYVPWAVLFLPLAFGVGTGVWLGVKLGKGRRFRFSLRTLAIATLLAGSGMGLWWRWDPWSVLMAFNEVPTDVGFAPDGSFFYTYRWSGAAKAACTTVWDTQTRTVRFSFAERAEKVGYWQDGIRSSPNARWFTVREQTGMREHVFDANTGQKVRLAVPGPVLLPETPFSPDGDRLVYSTDADVRLRHLPSGRETVFVVRAEFLPDYVTYLPRHERVVVQSRKRQPETTPEEVRILSQGSTVMGPVRVFDSETGSQIPLDLPPGFAPRCFVSPHVSSLIAPYMCEYDDNPHGVVVVDALSGRRISRIRRAVHFVWDAYFTPDDRLLVLRADDESHFYDPLTGTERFVAPGHTAWRAPWLETRYESAFSHDRLRVIQGGGEYQNHRPWAYIWDLERAGRVASLADLPSSVDDALVEFSQDDRVNHEILLVGNQPVHHFGVRSGLGRL